MGLFKKIRLFLEKIEDRIGVLRQFRLYTLLVMAIIGWLILSSLSAYTKNDVINRRHENAIVLSKSIEHNLMDDNLDKPLSPLKRKEIINFVKEQLSRSGRLQSKSDSLLGVVIYNKKGQSIFNPKKIPLLNKEKHRFDMQEAFKGEFINNVILISNKKEKGLLGTLTEQKYLDKVNEVYIPIYQKQKKPVAISKLYLDTTISDAYMSKSFRVVFLYVILGLIFLYLSLSWFFYRAHRRISKKNEELSRLTDKVIFSLKELEESYLGTMQALTMAVDAKDHYTAGHSFRVASFAKQIGQILGFTDEALENLEKGARFHDIGKIGIKESVLNKHGTLTQQEFTEIQKHTIIGAKIIEPVKSLQSIVRIVRSHHERIDGTGYPDGLKLDSIPMEARIVAVADCFDAMTTNRPNRRAYPASKAIELMREGCGNHFDKEVFEAFLTAYSGQQMWANKPLLKKTHKKTA